MLLIEGLAAGLLTGLADIKDLKARNPATLLIGTPLPTVLIFTLGALLATNEYRHGTANHTFVITPRRERVIAAKLAVGLVVGIVAALLYITVNAGLGLSILSSRGVDVDGDLAVNIYSGVGTGHRARLPVRRRARRAAAQPDPHDRHRASCCSSRAASFALFIGNDVGKYFPGEALLALQGTPGAETTLLDQVGGGLVLAATCAALAVAGVFVTRYREIN